MTIAWVVLDLAALVMAALVVGSLTK